MKRGFLLVFATLFSLYSATAATFTATSNGDWNSGPTWGKTSNNVPGTDYPTTGDIAIIKNKRVTVNGTSACQSLSIETTTLTVFRISGSLTVSSSIDITQTGGTTTLACSGSLSANVLSYTNNNTSGTTFNYNINGGNVNLNVATITVAKTNSKMAMTQTGGTNTIASFCGLTTNDGGLITIAQSGGTTTSSFFSISHNPNGNSGGGLTITMSGASTVFENTSTFQVSTSTISEVTVDLSSSNSTFKLGGSFSGPTPNFLGGSSGSTLQFNGPYNQTIPLSSGTMKLCNFKNSNTSGSPVTSDAAFTSTNLTGNLINDNGSFFDDNGFTNTIGGSLQNAGTFTASGDLTIGGGFTNSGTYTSSGNNINLAGNWNNSGTYTYNTGDVVTFNGASNQNIDGNTDWYDVTFNTSGATFNTGDHTIRHVFDIDAGSITNNTNITFLGDASGTAQMANINSGNFFGDIHMQRYFNKSAQSWVCVGTPLESNTLDAMHDDGIAPGQEFILTGYTGADYTASNWVSFINTYSYNANNVVSAKDDGWVAATNTTNPIGPDNDFKANFIYADAVDYNLRLTGFPNIGSTPIPLDYTNTGSPSEDGWNLITNPYPCTVDWESVRSGLSGVNDFYSVYTESGNFAYYLGGTLVGTNGATRYIPVMQGFWVQSTGGSSITFNESDKAPLQNPSFIKSGTESEVMRIALSGNVNSFSDEAVIIAGVNNTNAYSQNEQEIIKWHSMDSTTAPNLASFSTDNYELAFNSISSIKSVDISITARPGNSAQGNYTLAFTIPENYMNNACLSLEDLVTGNTTDLKVDTSYTFSSATSDPMIRFILHISRPFDITNVRPTCSNSADGSLEITGSNIDGQNFVLLDGNGSYVNSITASGNTANFDNLPTGNYTISTDVVSSCGENLETVYLQEQIEVDASFTTNSNTIDIGNNESLQVNSNTTGLTYDWDFGDGNTATGEYVSHTYTAAGNYNLVLTVDNGTCTNSSSTSIEVTNSTLGIASPSSNNEINAYLSNNHILIDLNLEQSNNLNFKLIDINGKMVVSKSNQNLQAGRIDLTSTNELSAGVYLVQIIGDNFTKTIKVAVK